MTPEEKTLKIADLALTCGRLRRELAAMVDLFESLSPEVQAEGLRLARAERETVEGETGG